MPISRFVAAKACALLLTIALPLIGGCASKAPVGCSGPKYPINDRVLNTTSPKQP
jgi:hypothetical protein